eukprot:6297965-Pyramimonas_sp.AAC.1
MRWIIPRIFGRRPKRLGATMSASKLMGSKAGFQSNATMPALPRWRASSEFKRLLTAKTALS